MSETIDLNKIEDRQLLSDTISEDIDSWCKEQWQGEHRYHLGASIIGKVCSRELWYSFRWAKKPDHDAKVLRIFQRGHLEEPRMIEYLEGIGCKLSFGHDEQVRVSDVGDHFGGSLDNEGYLPERYGIAEKVLFEFKTSNFSEFNKLKNKGVKDCKPIHFSQMCCYGVLRELKYAVYICVCKNNDELHIEVVELDHEHGRNMLEKASMIITSPIPLAKYSQSETNFVCKFCTFKSVCHHDEPLEKNCRTCIHSSPSSGGQWNCNKFNSIIPLDFQEQGCPEHEPIK